MKIHPKGEWLLVEPIEQSKMGSLWVPDTAEQTYLKGTILEVGDPDNEFTKARRIAVGENVIYDRVGAVKIALGGGKAFFLLKSREVMASFEEEA